MKIGRIGGCVLLVCMTLVGWGQEKINTDRPDQTEGTHVISPGQVQLEADFYYNEFQEEQAALISSSLLRVGLHKCAELRFVVEEGRQRDVFIDQTTQGVYPLSVGTKVSLLHEHDWIPNISLISYLQLPFTTKSSDYPMQWSPAFILATEYDIDKLSIDLNAGYKGNAYDPKGSAVGSLAFRYEWSEKLQSFVEYFGQYATQAHHMHNADFGVMYLCSETVLLNASFGHSLWAEAYNRFMMLGVGVRLPR